MSEATTRTLEEVRSPMTESIEAGPTAPAYLPPSPLQHASAPSTNPLSRGNKLLLIGLAGAFLLVVLVLSAWFVFYLTNTTPPSGGGSVAGVPQAPPPPALPPPPAPPAPPAPPVGDASTFDIGDLIYPGAKKGMEFTSSSGKGTLQLLTRDPPQKVIAWYRAKLKPTESVDLPGNNTIMKSGPISVVITYGQGETNILITKGDD